MTELALYLADLLGQRGWLSGADAAASSRDWLDRYGEPPLGVARPASTQEVCAIVRACREAGVSITPQGGNTSLCGAAVSGSVGSVILSLSRMARIGETDRAGGTITVEAGVVLAALHEHLRDGDLIFPLHLGAEGSAQIGGLIATNAGGSHALRYGMMQDLVVGLEVVLADGSVWDGMRLVQKDNAGYQLRRLFCGSEGTLGIVTRAALRVHPGPKTRTTALLASPDLESLVAFGAQLRAGTGEFVSGLEFFCELGLGWAEKHVNGIELPFATRAPWYLVVELTAASARIPLDDILGEELAQGMEVGWVLDGVIAGNEAQRAAIWRLREEQPEGQRLEGPQLKHDISVPPGRLADFIERAGVLCEGILPGVRINPFGHLGDGNVHYNLSPPESAGGFGGSANRLATELGALATSMQGSFAAEHGLGRSKTGLADALRSPVERRLMARVKQAFDPDNLMNPGVIVGTLPRTGGSS